MPRRTTPDPAASKVGARIRELRLERNMSLAALAGTGALSKGHLSNIERGRVSITLPTVARIARGLDVPAFALLNFPGEDEFAFVVDQLLKIPKAEMAKLWRELSGKPWKRSSGGPRAE
jgi:transcriptional regulator with XRE-family HTH domain